MRYVVMEGGLQMKLWWRGGLTDEAFLIYSETVVYLLNPLLVQGYTKSNSRPLVPSNLHFQATPWKIKKEEYSLLTHPCIILMI